MKSITEFLFEVGEAPQVAVPAQAEPKDSKQPNISLWTYSEEFDKNTVAAIYDKILNSLQIVQFDDSEELEHFFDLDDGAMEYVNSMNLGDSNEDDNSILTIIWKKTE